MFMPKVSKFLLFICLIVVPFLPQAQEKAPRKIKILPVPAIGYSPETNFYLGAVSLFTFNLYNDSLTRMSNASMELNFTWNKQLIAESDWNFFFKEEKWFTNGELHFSKYPDLYYGIGSETPEENEFDYESKRFRFNVSVLKNLGAKWFAGPVLTYQSINDLNWETEKNPFPELKDGNSFGVGVTVLKDSRNNILTPTKGLYLKLGGMHHFSKSDFQQVSFDFRFYKTWKEKYTLANRFYSNFTSNTPPFYNYSLLGGDQFVRGYYLGRFRDKHLSTWQSEFRFPIYRRFHAALFGGLSNLYSSKNSFDFSQTKPNYGVGLRYLVDKTGNTFLRLDYAMGENENNGFYISFGESF